MKMLKKIGFALVIAAAAGSFSSAAFAEVDAGRIVYAPADALDLVVSKVKAARVAIQENKSRDDIAAAIKDALDASKEVNANDRVDVARLRANDILKRAKSQVKNGGDLNEVDGMLEKAAADFEAVKKLI